MSRARADKNEPNAAHVTTYEVSHLEQDDPNLPPLKNGAAAHMWRPMGTIQTTSGAAAAIRLWAEQQGDSFTGGTLRAVPTSRITERDVKVETRRQLTLGAP